MGANASSDEAKNQAAVSEADLEFVYETAKAGLTVLNKIITTKVYDSTLAVDSRLEPEALKFSKEVDLPADEIDLVGKSCKAIAAKYTFLAAYAPEMMLAGWMASYGLRVTNVLREIKQLQKAVAAMKGPGIRKGEDAGPPQAD